MKRAVSVSLGSSRRDKVAELELFGERVAIERRGTDGDADRAAELFRRLDGEVDALGVGGIDLSVQLGERHYPLRAAQRLVRGVRSTPVVDGNGLKNTLEREVVETLVAEVGPDLASGRVLLTAAVDRSGMTRAFFDSGYEVVCGDLMFGLGLPVALRSMTQLRWVVRAAWPLVGRMPIRMLYPTGRRQEQIVPRFGRWYAWADVIAGDCHYVKRHMPESLAGKIVVTNTTTREDMAAFRRRGVAHVVTTTPVLDGRSFGTNVMEAALTAAAGKGRRLTVDELARMVAELDLHPTVHSGDEAWTAS